jgi:uncharacterized iron-regulated membrane protein
MIDANVLPPGLVAGSVFTLLGVLCLVFSASVGGWIRRIPLAAFGVREKAVADETVYRGLACVAGLLVAGVGLALLAQWLV